LIVSEPFTLVVTANAVVTCDHVPLPKDVVDDPKRTSVVLSTDAAVEAVCTVIPTSHVDWPKSFEIPEPQRLVSAFRMVFEFDAE